MWFSGPRIALLYSFSNGVIFLVTMIFLFSYYLLRVFKKKRKKTVFFRGIVIVIFIFYTVKIMLLSQI